MPIPIYRHTHLLTRIADLLSKYDCKSKNLTPTAYGAKMELHDKLLKHKYYVEITLQDAEDDDNILTFGQLIKEMNKEN